MVASKSARSKAWTGLKDLLSDKADPDGPMGATFNWINWRDPPFKSDPREDRANVLVATTVVEQALEHALLKTFVRKGAEIRDQLFDGDSAPLRDLSAKIRLAHAMGLIGNETRSDLSAVRRIRNTFAHSRLKIDLDTPQISAACEQITLLRRWKELTGVDNDAEPREVFLTSCLEYSLWLFVYDSLGDRQDSKNFQVILLQQ